MIFYLHLLLVFFLLHYLIVCMVRIDLLVTHYLTNTHDIFVFVPEGARSERN